MSVLTIRVVAAPDRFLPIGEGLIQSKTIARRKMRMTTDKRRMMMDTVYKEAL
jgi:hypothetical protein